MTIALLPDIFSRKKTAPQLERGMVIVQVTILNTKFNKENESGPVGSLEIRILAFEFIGGFHRPDTKALQIGVVNVEEAAPAINIRILDDQILPHGDLTNSIVELDLCVLARSNHIAYQSSEQAIWSDTLSNDHLRVELDLWKGVFVVVVRIAHHHTTRCCAQLLHLCP